MFTHINHNAPSGIRNPHHTLFQWVYTWWQHNVRAIASHQPWFDTHQIPMHPQHFNVMTGEPGSTAFNAITTQSTHTHTSVHTAANHTQTHTRSTWTSNLNRLLFKLPVDRTKCGDIRAYVLCYGLALPKSVHNKFAYIKCTWLLFRWWWCGMVYSDVSIRVCVCVFLQIIMLAIICARLC